MQPSPRGHKASFSARGHKAHHGARAAPGRAALGQRTLASSASTAILVVKARLIIARTFELNGHWHGSERLRPGRRPQQAAHDPPDPASVYELELPGELPAGSPVSSPVSPSRSTPPSSPHVVRRSPQTNPAQEFLALPAQLRSMQCWNKCMRCMLGGMPPSLTGAQALGTWSA